MKETRVRKFGGSSEHWEDQVTLRPLDKYDFKEWLFKKEELDKYTFEAAKLFEVKDNFSNKDIRVSEGIQIKHYKSQNKEITMKSFWKEI